VLTNSLSKNEFTLHYEKVTSYIEKFQEDIEWCRYFGFVTSLSDPHSNSYEIKYTDKNNIHYSQKICLVSGETDPIDYNYENKLLERYKIEILQLKQKHEFEYQLEKLKHKYDEFNSKTTDITTSFERKLENSKKAITSTMDKLKDSEKNSVQILGIFSAIALFTTGSISFFKDNILSASEAVAFILGYGFVLALFIIVLHFVFYYRYDKEKQHQKMHHKLIKYLVIGIVIIALFLVVHSKPILTWLNLTN
jgi:heme/copper-type cytochrome/quinol oxidase subunit 4